MAGTAMMGQLTERGHRRVFEENEGSGAWHGDRDSNME